MSDSPSRDAEQSIADSMQRMDANDLIDFALMARKFVVLKYGDPANQQTEIAAADEWAVTERLKLGLANMNDQPTKE